MANECISFYEPGTNLTVLASAAITGCRFLKISGNRNATAGGPAEGLITVAHADAAGRIAGVSQSDIASGAIGGLVRGSGRVVPVDSSGAIAAFAEVEVGATGKAVTIASGKAVGYAVTAAANNVVQVCLY